MKRLLAGLVFVILLSLLAVAWWKVSLSPVDASDPKVLTFVIDKGDGIREIARKLRDAGLIRDQVAFFLLVKKLGIEKSIQAGTFQLSPSLSATQLAQKLTVGTTDVWVTVPEGWRSEEILDYLEKQGFDTTGQDWKFDEGKLFPDTYRLPKQMSLDAVRELFKKNFDEKVGQVSLQDIILASLVEREAKKESDRPLVASVLKNRLTAGMALDVDATIQYVFGKPGNWWPKDLSLDNLKVKSPYNTYTNPGLPPAPICNPGLSSIRAVQNPAKTDYLFYVSDKQGNIHYAKTLSDHNANVARYLQ